MAFHKPIATAYSSKAHRLASSGRFPEIPDALTIGDWVNPNDRQNRTFTLPDQNRDQYGLNFQFGGRDCSSKLGLFMGIR